MRLLRINPAKYYQLFKMLQSTDIQLGNGFKYQYIKVNCFKSYHICTPLYQTLQICISASYLKIYVNTVINNTYDILSFLKKLLF